MTARHIDQRGRIEPAVGVLNATSIVTSSDSRILDLFDAGPTAAGASVTPNSSMRLSVVYACVRLIAGAIAGLPKSFYQRNDNGGAIKTRHPYWWLLNELMAPAFPAAAAWEYIAATVLLRGDCICYIARNRQGVPTAIIPWPREHTVIKRVPGANAGDPPTVRYFFHDEGRYFGADAGDVLHFSGFGYNHCNTFESMSVIQWGARNGIGIAIKGDEFAGKFFGTGAQPQFAVTTPNKMSGELQQKFSDAFERKYSGNGPNSKPLMLTEGLQVQQLTMSAVDAQLLESRQWQVVDVCRAFGVPPFMVAEMGKATYNNTENLGVDFVKYSLSPHLVRWEQEINIKLFRTATYYVRFNVDGLQRGDLQARANYYKAAIGGTQAPAWMSANQIRELEDMPPMDGGDSLYRPKEALNGASAPDSQQPAESASPAEPRQQQS